MLHAFLVEIAIRSTKDVAMPFGGRHWLATLKPKFHEMSTLMLH